MEVFNTSYMGAIFKAARKQADMTQEQVAEQVDITPRFLMGLEKGLKNVQPGSPASLSTPAQHPW